MSLSSKVVPLHHSLTGGLTKKMERTWFERDDEEPNPQAYAILILFVFYAIQVIFWIWDYYLYASAARDWRKLYIWCQHRGEEGWVVKQHHHQGAFSRLDDPVFEVTGIWRLHYFFPVIDENMLKRFYGL